MQRGWRALDKRLVKCENGCKNVQGYFAKAMSEEWSLNTIFIFEHCRGKGFGKKLIALSYLLQKESGKEASPKGPLSESGGKAAFHNFWRSEVLDFLLQRIEDQGKLSLQDITFVTGIAPLDISNTLTDLGLIRANREADTFLSHVDTVRVKAVAQRPACSVG